MKIDVITICSPAHEKFLKQLVAQVQLCSAMTAFDVSHKVLHDENWQGQSMFRNQLIQNSNSDLIAFMDADDLPETNWLTKMVPEMFFHGYDVVYCDYRMEYKDGSKKNIYTQPFDEARFRKVNFIPFSGSIIRTKIAQQCEFPDQPHGNDWLFWWCVYKCTKRFGYVSGLYVTRREWSSYKRSNVPVYRKLRRLWRDWKVRNQIKRVCDTD